MILCTLFTSFAVIFNKKGAMNFSLTLQGTLFNWSLIIGVVLLGIGFVVLSFALQYDEVSVLYPIISLSFIWAYFLSIIFYNESFYFRRLIGILLIVLGVVVILSFDLKKGNKK